MKTGRTLQELAAEIERQAKAKEDFLAPTERLTMVATTGLVLPNDPTVQVMGLGDKSRALTTHAHAQLASEVGIPKKYYDRCLIEAPDLLATNVNKWWRTENKVRLFRALDGRIRGVLSDRYRPLDYVQLAQAVLPVLQALELNIMSCEVTEHRLYIKAVDKSITKDIPKGHAMGDGSHVFFDTLSPAIVISNSEVGLGRLLVETGVWIRMCTNMAIAAEASLRKYHLGGRLELGDELVTLLSEDTRRKTDAALWGQVRDVVKGAFDRVRFDAYCHQIETTGENKIKGNPVKAMEVVSVKFGLGEEEAGGVLRHLIEGGDLSQYGLFNAITRTAEDLSDYDRATEFERMGGQVIELKADDWSAISEAA